MKTMISLLFAVCVVTACNQAEAPADASVITSGSDAWETALNAKDVDAIVELYTKDARIMPPNGATTSGRDAVRAAFGGMIDEGLGGTLTSVEAGVAGDIGYNVGNYELTADGAVVDTGRFVEIWHRGDDGQWRIANDIWNSDRPIAKLGREMKGRDTTHVMITHEVEDADLWLAAWRGEDSRHELFKANGANHVHTFRSSENPNLTGLVVAVEDMAAFEAMLQSDDGKAAAAEDGVVRESVTMLTEAK